MPGVAAAVAATNNGNGVHRASYLLLRVSAPHSSALSAVATDCRTEEEWPCRINY